LSIRASTDDHIWGEVYEGDWKEIFDIQINFVKQVAYELKTVLSLEEVKKIEEEPTKNIEAYNLYLQGRYFWGLGGKDNLDKSIKCYQQALKINPDYALAYSGLAASGRAHV
jgi:adenylate cyclase